MFAFGSLYRKIGTKSKREAKTCGERSLGSTELYVRDVCTLIMPCSHIRIWNPTLEREESVSDLLGDCMETDNILRSIHSFLCQSKADCIAHGRAPVSGQYSKGRSAATETLSIRGASARLVGSE